MRMLSDTEIYELIDHMQADGAITRFTVDRSEVHRVIVDAIGRELAARGEGQSDVTDAKRLGAEARDLSEAITQLREGLLADAEYENRSVRQLLREHALYRKLSDRLAEIRAELVAKVGLE